MKYIRAKAGFIRYSDEKFLLVASRIISCLKGSDIFIEPTPSLSEVEEAYADYAQKVIQAAHKGIQYTAQKRDSKRKLADLFQELVFYVNTVSDGDLLKLYSSGFPVLAKKHKGEAPQTPKDPHLMNGRVSGEVAFAFKPVGRDMLYDYCFAIQIDGQGHPIWGEILTTSRSFKSYSGGYEPGKYIYFKVRARNKHGASDWTAPVMFMVR